MLLSRPLRHAVQGVAALVVAAGSVGVAHYDKAVQVSVDGQPTSVHVLGSTVADVLDKQDITVGPHDVVVPSLGTAVDDGDHISVRIGRKLTVTVDGVTKEYWTTATTVDARAHRPRHPRRRCRALRLALPAARPRRPDVLRDDAEEGHRHGRRQDPLADHGQPQGLGRPGRARHQPQRPRHRGPRARRPRRRRHEDRPQARRREEGDRHGGDHLLHDQAEGLLALRGPDQGRHPRQGRQEDRRP